MTSRDPRPTSGGSGAADHDPTGLCGDCVHCKRIETKRGSVFFQCLRAKTDPKYQKYPSLPVRSCPGHETAA
ncbi:MAG: hypothetical protein AAGF12_08775 [Myxococcota bacterium]